MATRIHMRSVSVWCVYVCARRCFTLIYFIKCHTITFSIILLLSICAVIGFRFLIKILHLCQTLCVLMLNLLIHSLNTVLVWNQRSLSHSRSVRFLDYSVSTEQNKMFSRNWLMIFFACWFFHFNFHLWNNRPTVVCFAQVKIAFVCSATCFAFRKKWRKNREKKYECFYSYEIFVCTYKRFMVFIY